MTKRIIYIVGGLLFLAFIGLLFILMDCGDFYSVSPEELLRKNDYVLFGNFIAMDTLADLGSLNYLDSESKFMIVEYTFQSKSKFKGEEKPKVYLWTCEHVRLKDNYSTIDILEKYESALVYGKKITQFHDVVNVMTPITFIDDLKSLLEGKRPSRIETGWNTMHGDSIIASRILNTDKLKSTLDQRNLNGQVIFGTDQYLATFVQFRQGSLCYYDSADKARNVSREEYLEILSSQSLPPQ
jgi:hypothetical protein